MTRTTQGHLCEIHPVVRSFSLHWSPFLTQGKRQALAILELQNSYHLKYRQPKKHEEGAAEIRTPKKSHVLDSKDTFGDFGLRLIEIRFQHQELFTNRQKLAVHFLMRKEETTAKSP